MCTCKNGFIGSHILYRASQGYLEKALPSTSEVELSSLVRSGKFDAMPVQLPLLGGGGGG